MLPMINGRRKRGKRSAWSSRKQYTLRVTGSAENEETLMFLTRLGLSKADIDDLYTCFMEIAGKKAKANARTFSLQQFYHWAKVRTDEITDFHADIWTVLEDGEIGNGINFREFALVMWNFLSLHEEAGTTLPDFVYFIKDQKGNGILLNKEVRDIIWGMHGSDGEIVGRINEVLNSFNVLDDEVELGTTMESFAEMNRIIPFLCYPAFRLMKLLRRRIIGQDFWMRHRTKRRDRYQDAVDLWAMLAREFDDDSNQVDKNEDKRLPRMVPPRLAREVEFDDYYRYKKSELLANEAVKKARERDERLGIARPQTPEHAKWGVSKVTMGDALNHLREREEQIKATELEHMRRRKEATMDTKAQNTKKKKKKKKSSPGTLDSSGGRMSSFSDMRKVSAGMGKFF